MQWPGRDSPPRDIPICGFNNDALECLPEEGFPIIKTILFLLLTIILIGSGISYFVYKHMKLEASLADCWWKIDYNELDFFDEKTSGKKSTISLASESSFLSKFKIRS